MMSETIKPFSGPNFEKNEKRVKDGQTGCAYCGKPCVNAKDTEHAVHVIEGGAAFATKEQHEGDAELSGDMGEFPVGSSCAKKLAKAGIYVFKPEWC